jgi:hypothetical protein
MPDLDIQSVRRVDCDLRSTVGELRAALSDSRIPDDAKVIFIDLSHVADGAATYTMDDFMADRPVFEHYNSINLVIEWEEA